MSHPSEHEWVTTSTMLQRLSDFDDRGAWERFSARFLHPIQAYARKRGLGHEEAEDVAQESLLAFAQAYADQNDADYRALQAAVESGRISAHLGL